MIRIASEELIFAEKLAGVRRSFKPSDGAKSWPRYHELVYEGGNKLIFRTTDLRISLVSRLPVEGEDQPWGCRVLLKNFAGQAKYAEGGRYTLDSSPPNYVRVGKGVVLTALNPNGAQALPDVAVAPPLPSAEDIQISPRVDDILIPGGPRGSLDAPIAEDAPPTPDPNGITMPSDTVEAPPPPSEEGVPTGNAGGTLTLGELARTPTAPNTEFRYQYPFWKVPVDTPFPEMLLFEPDRPAPRISLDKLRRALRFLMASRNEKDPECRLNVCSIMPSQLVGTWNDGVFVQTEGPAVDAPINLATADAFRLAEWLQLLHWRREIELQILRVANDVGKTTILFATPNLNHCFQVVGTARSFPIEFFTNLQAVEPTIRGTLPREELRCFAGCFSRFVNCHLRFTFRRQNDQWILQVTPSREVPCGGGLIPIQVQQSQERIDENPPFLASAAQLLSAVNYHRGEKVRFTLRQRAKTLTLSSPTDDNDGAADDVHQTHVRGRFDVTE